VHHDHDSHHHDDELHPQPSSVTLGPLDVQHDGRRP
jgi:zinc transport system ATP-binding protein